MQKPTHTNSIAVPTRTNKYRTDVEGLRGVAVLAIILFHIDASWLPGGFVGVDGE